MRIETAKPNDIPKIQNLDRHIPSARLLECVDNARVLIMRDCSNTDCKELEAPIAGVLRYSLFWQTIPFLELLYVDEKYRRQGVGAGLMDFWENAMRSLKYKYVLTSTQADEDAWRFYEKLKYSKVGSFLPPEQEAEEWIYLKSLESDD